MDRRVSGALMGGVLGVVLVALLAFLRPPTSPFDPDGGIGLESPYPSISYPPVMRTEALYDRFASLGSATSYGEPAELSVIRAGDLVLVTGRVVAADSVFFETEPFTRWLPKGRHPVFLLRAEYPEDQRAAAVMIRVAEGDPVRWELALKPGQDDSGLGPDDIIGYGVDSGTGAFASAEAVERILADEALSSAYADEVTNGLYPSEDPVDYRLAVDVVIEPATGINIVAFGTGFGDGAYPSYFGLDAAGDPIVLMTNFGILDAAP